MEFISDFVKWSKNKELNSCLILNFGYDNPLPYFQISLTSTDSPISFNLKSSGMAAPKTCSIVIISNQYLQEIENITKLIKDFTEESLAVPLAMFILSNEEENIQIISETKNSYLPTIVYS